jgi:hypothetical protein
MRAALERTGLVTFTLEWQRGIGAMCSYQDTA